MFGNTISMAHKAMDFLWKKQEVIASNIANVDTPGYKNKNVAFEDIYRRRLQIHGGEQDEEQRDDASGNRAGGLPAV